MKAVRQASGRVASVLAGVSLAVVLATSGAGGRAEGAGPPSGAASGSCRSVAVRVAATHWVWRRKTRRVHGRRVLVRRHGRIVYVHVRARYKRLRHRRACATPAPAPFGASAPLAIAAPGTPATAPAIEPSGPPVNGAPPSIAGVPASGATLSASSGSWSGSPRSYAFEWERCDAGGGSCQQIAGASSSTYALGAPDVGSTVRVSVVASNAAGVSTPAVSRPTAVVIDGATVQHLEYAFVDGTAFVYDADHGYRLVKTIDLPQTAAGVRGVSVAPSSHMLFISYGGDGVGFNGSVLAYDLVAERVAWTVHLNTGVDSGEVSPDGTRLYMPTGENTPSGVWNVLDTASGALLGTIQGGAGAHNTIVSRDGRYVYLGGRDYDYLDVYDTGTGAVREIGPLINTVRPFTVNGSNTFAFTTATSFDGFQVSSVVTGTVLFSVSLGPVSAGFRFTAPSHGISLSPDERQLFVIDSVHKEVQAYDVSRVSEGIAPVRLGSVAVRGLIGNESPCAYDCGRDGWLQRSVDGRFVYVGDSGEVIETATRKVLATLPALLDTRKSLEIDWSQGVPIASSERTGVGEFG